MQARHHRVAVAAHDLGIAMSMAPVSHVLVPRKCIRAFQADGPCNSSLHQSKLREPKETARVVVTSLSPCRELPDSQHTGQGGQQERARHATQVVCAGSSGPDDRAVKPPTCESKSAQTTNTDLLNGCRAPEFRMRSRPHACHESLLMA